MKRRNFFRVALWAALAVALQAPIASVGAADSDDWIGTWTASPQPVWDADFLAPVKVGAERSHGRQCPAHVQALYHAGDHLHPNDAGYKAMAESIDLKQLTGKR
jgi:lysophospholipase L1-like esterase